MWFRIVEKPVGVFHAPMRFDRFAPSTGQLSGRIILAKDFDSEMGTGGKVYLNVGANQGLKVGDYVRALRSYETTAHDAVDSLSFKSLDPGAQAGNNVQEPHFLSWTNGPVARTSEMPRRAVGEILIIGVNPGTATGMVVCSHGAGAYRRPGGTRPAIAHYLGHMWHEANPRAIFFCEDA